MKLHEYQAKEIFRQNGVNVPFGKVATDSAQAKEIAQNLKSEIYVVKSQIHAGGRGKGKIYSAFNFEPNANNQLILDGGVKIAKSVQEVEEISKNILGNILVTKQSGNEGKKVNYVLIEEGIKIAKDPSKPERDFELYLAVTLDRAKNSLCLMACAEGGVEIEEVAARNPEAIIKEWFLPSTGLFEFQARNIAFKLGLTDKTQISKLVKMLIALAKVYIKIDASLVEVNPCVITQDNDVIALDGKINIEDNGLYRQKEIEKMRDLSEENPTETKAHQANLSYIKLDGDIGCLVNGAGLAMATMDIIKLYGGEKHGPANFLDVGGGANKEQVKTAFSIILEDKNVKAILVNIFGGILLCDVVADGIASAAREIGLKVPLVVRLEGNESQKGREILESAGLNIVSAIGMADAAQKVVAAI